MFSFCLHKEYSNFNSEGIIHIAYELIITLFLERMKLFFNHNNILFHWGREETKIFL